MIRFLISGLVTLLVLLMLVVFGHPAPATHADGTFPTFTTVNLQFSRNPPVEKQVAYVGFITHIYDPSVFPVYVDAAYLVPGSSRLVPVRSIGNCADVGTNPCWYYPAAP